MKNENPMEILQIIIKTVKEANCFFYKFRLVAQNPNVAQVRNEMK